MHETDELEALALKLRGSDVFGTDTAREVSVSMWSSHLVSHHPTWRGGEIDCQVEERRVDVKLADCTGMLWLYTMGVAEQQHARCTGGRIDEGWKNIPDLDNFHFHFHSLLIQHSAIVLLSQCSKHNRHLSSHQQKGLNWERNSRTSPDVAMKSLENIFWVKNTLTSV